MIEKMKFLSITGPKSDIDRVVNEYLAKYEIHLENAMAQLTQVQHLSPYIQINPYKEILNKATEFAGLLQDTEDVPIRDISLDEATDLIDSLSQKLSDINAECDDLKAKRTAFWSNRIFSVSWLLTALMIWKIMVSRIRNMPKTIATMKTVFMLPRPGTLVMASTGRSHMGSSTSSNPKMQPSMKPKKVEKIPAVPMMAARSIFLNL